MKLPKKIHILHKTFEIKREDDVYGAFYFEDKDNDKKPTIYITKSKKDEEVLEVFIHEVLEVICELLRIRYTRPDNNEYYEFHYTHQQHDTISKVLSQVLCQVESIKK